MGVEFFLGAILESNTDIYSTICPWNQLNLILQTRLIQFGKKITHLLLAFQELDIEIDLSLYLQILNI
jgi:hypothetical protein